MHFDPTFMLACQTNLFFAPFINTQIKNQFPRREDAVIQNRIVPEWRLLVRDCFEKVLPLNGQLRRFITVVLPENIVFPLSTLYYINGGSKAGLIQMFSTLGLATTSIVFIVTASFIMEFMRVRLALDFQDFGVPVGFTSMMYPSDGRIAIMEIF
jgi:hypothetical protein